MRILGISAFYHDAAAALLVDGQPVAAVQEERFTRIKHDAAFPRHAIAYCLEQGGKELDAVVFYEKPLLKLERILKTFFSVAPRGFASFCSAIPSWLDQKLWTPSAIEESLAECGVDYAGKIYFASHHESHAASAFFASPFDEAAILTLDGVGEWTTTVLGHGEGPRMESLLELSFPHSLGLLYAAFTYFCGFRVNSGEYKLMGLAPYGKPRYVQRILDHLIDLKKDGSFRLNLEYFDYLRGQRMTNRRFAKLFGGEARQPEAAITQRELDLARSIQEVTEIVVLRMLDTLRERTGSDRLCMAGGVALNCVANGRAAREGPFKEIWVQPAAGDAGGALGAAFALYHSHFQQPRRLEDGRDLMSGARLGPAFGPAEIAQALTARGLEAQPLAEYRLLELVVDSLEAGDVVGYFRGRAEFGPRALGGRSILGDARNPDMQRRMNLKIKFRESFRPFAPIVLEERASSYFDLSFPSPYMLFTAPVSEARRRPRSIPSEGARSLFEQVNELRSDIPAVTHVDYSARAQTVSCATDPDLHALLAAFERRTACPVLVNTSFNVRGEPPVCAPEEAIDCFLDTEMDCLAIGPYFLRKSDLPATILRTTPQREFALD